MGEQRRGLEHTHGINVSEPIAIVGIGCRFPGGADDPGRFLATADTRRRRDR